MAMLLFGGFPAIQTSNLDISGALKSESAAGGIGSRSKSWLRSALLLVRVALSFVLGWARACCCRVCSEFGPPAQVFQGTGY